MTRNIIKIVVFLLLSVQLAWSQYLPKLKQQFVKGQGAYNDKVYVHLNKPNYLTSETIWFKIYNFNTSNGLLSNISKIAYVELLTEKLEPKLQVMVSLENGMGDGYLGLPSSLGTGQYFFRVYTNLMKNGGADIFYEQKLNIFNINNLTTHKNKSKEQYKVSFFPEGGALLDNTSANVAFKITNSGGKGVAVTGAIIDNKNDTVSLVKTTTSGIGKFVLNPKSSEKYKLICTSKEKEIIIKELPSTEKNGYSIMLKDNLTQWDFTISTNTNINTVYSIVHDGRKVVFASENNLTQGKTRLILDKEKLNEGLHILTIFDSKGSPVAERIFYKPITKRLNLNLFANNLYAPRKKVEIAITPEQIGLKSESLKSYASMSVYRLNALPETEEIDIVTYMYLTSELKETIENPSVYLSESKIGDLDDLLLTQGWRRFNWKTSKEGILKFLPEYNGNLISGNLTSSKGSSEKGLPVYLTSTRKPDIFYHTATDSSGNFLFNPGKLTGSHEIIIQSDFTKDSTSKISLYSSFYQNMNKEQMVSNLPLLEFNSSELFKDPYFAQQVETFYNLKSFKETPYTADTAMFYNKADKSYILAEYTKFNTLEDVLREYVSEVTVLKRQQEFNLKIIGGKEFLSENPLVLYDGVPYFDLKKIMSKSTDDIYKLELITEKYYYNGQTYHGIIHFLSKKANVSNFELNPNAIIIDFEGLQLQRNFVETRYDSDSELNSSLPNFKSAVYWNPSIMLEGGKTKSLSFYTPDLEGTYIGVIQGVSADGTPGFNTFKIEVKK
ncbi:MAG: hypothetical protein REI64_14855 [Pedobacter sp.]|nr:hypothetical protein [Pedobacter sp.]